MWQQKQKSKEKLPQTGDTTISNSFLFAELLAVFDLEAFLIIAKRKNKSLL